MRRSTLRTGRLGTYGALAALALRQPRLDSWNGTLESTAYAKKYDSWLGTTQWLVRGESTFWGSKTVTIKGSAVGGTSGSRHFHAGSGTGNQIDANAAVRITVK